MKLRKIIRRAISLYWAARTTWKEEWFLAEAIEKSGGAKGADVIERHIERAIAEGIAKRGITVPAPPPDYRKYVRPISNVRASDYRTALDMQTSTWRREHAA